jgi:hypothetical protein
LMRRRIRRRGCTGRGGRCSATCSPVAVNECLKRRDLENSRQLDFILPASRGSGYVIIIVFRYG